MEVFFLIVGIENYFFSGICKIIKYAGIVCNKGISHIQYLIIFISCRKSLDMLICVIFKFQLHKRVIFYIHQLIVFKTAVHFFKKMCSIVYHAFLIVFIYLTSPCRHINNYFLIVNLKLFSQFSASFSVKKYGISGVSFI